MSTNAHIEGIDDVLSFLDHMPEKMFNVTNTAMRQASKAVSSHIRKRIPKRYRKLCSYRIKKTYNNQLYTLIGMFNKHQATGHQPKNGKTWDWFKMYWANYGTLKHRDPSHEFQYAIKKKTKKRRNDSGQPAERFFENAIQGWEEVFSREFDNALANSTDKLYK